LLAVSLAVLLGLNLWQRSWRPEHVR
jgi:hypothetical protein